MTDATNNPENVVQRRRASDWQAPACKPWTEQEHDAATDASDEQSLRLYGLSKLVELAAFAGEARRALTSLNAAFEYRPKVRDDLRAHARLLEWAEVPDVTGEALQFLAGEIRQAGDELNEMVYKLANRLRDNGHDMSGRPQAQGRAA